MFWRVGGLYALAVFLACNYSFRTILSYFVDRGGFMCGFIQRRRAHVRVSNFRETGFVFVFISNVSALGGCQSIYYHGGTRDRQGRRRRSLPHIFSRLDKISYPGLKHVRSHTYMVYPFTDHIFCRTVLNLLAMAMPVLTRGLTAEALNTPMSAWETGTRYSWFGPNINLTRATCTTAVRNARVDECALIYTVYVFSMSCWYTKYTH